MRDRHFFLLFAFFLLLQPTFATAAPLRFAPLPIYNEARIRQDYYPFTQYLERGVQQAVEIVYRSDCQDIIAGLGADEIDLALLGPLPFALALKQGYNISALVQFLNSAGQSTYTCSVGVFAANNLSMTHLKNQQIALTQPYSTCGFLMVEHLLNQHGSTLADNQFEYSGTHSGSALQVITGKASVCGLKTSIGKSFHSLGLDLIAESDVIPSVVLVVNQRTLSPATIASIKKHLLALQPLENQEDALLTKKWGKLVRYGAIQTNAENYKFITDLLHRIDIPGVTQ
ncbi:MAG: PhnD/SsuA/transferrin family substrate-binding protein [Thermodesulfobacteriota bacterium]|nr:PhnD/SsuA/transferrin family substrate-binding protein [Thermodesulfobacteriota bacterium]